MDEKKVREAIELLKNEIDIVKTVNAPGLQKHAKRNAELYSFSIEALENQLAKKPNKIKDAYTPKIGEFIVGKCPNCGMNVSDRFDVCLDCGQKLDWSVEDE